MINRTLHGRLEIRNFSFRVEKIFHSFAFQHSKKNFVSPRGHVISSIYFVISQPLIEEYHNCYPTKDSHTKGKDISVNNKQVIGTSRLTL